MCWPTTKLQSIHSTANQMAPRTHRNALQPGFEILWYRIESILGQGGFGITYLATDTKLDLPVAIKEYMPMELASREGDSSVAPVTDDREEAFEWGRTRFLDEAKTLAKFKHPNTVRVLFYTEANNTGYMVMEYEAGQGLDARLRRDDPFDQQSLLQTFLPLLDGLSVVHSAGFIHRDIKPANIFIRQDGSPVLLDFGAARQAIAGHTRTLTAVVSPGYAPFEQYAASGVKQGPWTDIYAMGATMYHVVVGRAPPDAITRSSIMHEEPDPLPPAIEAGSDRFSRETLEAIDRALSFRERDRPQTVLEWRDMLTGEQPAFDSAEPATEIGVVPEQRKSPWGMLAVALLTVLLAGGSFYYTAYLMPRDEEGGQNLPASTSEALKEVPTPVATTGEQSPAVTETTQVQPAVDPLQPAIESAVTELEAQQQAAEAAAQQAAEMEAEQGAAEEAAQQATEIEAKRKLAEAAAQQAARQREALVQDLLKEADKDFDAGRFVGARERYAVVLSLEPTDPAALSGYERLFVNHLQLAVTALGEQRFELARRHLGDARVLDLHPERVDAALSEVEVAEVEWNAAEDKRRKRAEEHEKLQAELERQRLEQTAKEQAELDTRAQKTESLLLEGEDHLSALRLTSPAGSNAFEAFVAVLEIGPDNRAAVAGLKEIAKRYRGLAAAAAGEGNYRKALGYLARAIERFETGVPTEISPQAITAIDKTVAGLRDLRTGIQSEAREAERVAAETERRAKEAAEERRRAAEEAARLAALIKQRADLERQQHEFQQAQQEALAQEQVHAAKRSRYNVAIAAAQRAEDAFDRDAAISKYSEALSVFPDDPVANNGLSRVSDRWFGTCGAITGNWRYSTGGLVTLDADGTAKHDLVVVFNAVGTWECLNPARREIRITWNTGFTDVLTVMSGARRLEGKNNLGLPVWGDRE